MVVFSRHVLRTSPTFYVPQIYSKDVSQIVGSCPPSLALQFQAAWGRLSTDMMMKRVFMSSGCTGMHKKRVLRFRGQQFVPCLALI